MVGPALWQRPVAVEFFHPWHLCAQEARGVVRQVTTPQAVAIIVVNHEQATLIDESGALNENSMALTYFSGVCGARFDLVLVLDPPVNQKELDWLENEFVTHVKPGGSFRYPSS